MTRWLMPACLAAALLAAACEEPPNKEMDQAQGAIDAARAAGAEQYASAEYKAAVDALAQSRQAAAERDYRLALNNALDSFQRAQNAAREAADTKARLRGEAERTMAEIAVLLAEAGMHVDTAEARRVSRGALRAARAQIARVNEEVQKAGAAMKNGDYPGVVKLLDGVKPQIEKVIAELEARVTSQSPRRRG
jgi:hypothetical protein